jgi:uncharacterized damage-inducible protein DinB
MTSGEIIADEIRSALRGDPWHGPSLLTLVGDLTVQEAVQRPIPGAHNIWELVLHITSWSTIALRRINGGQHEVYEGEDWPEPGAISSGRWSEMVAEMSESHEQLCDVVAGLSDDRLAELAPGGSRTITFMLHGIAQHDAYHGGQVALLRKALTTKHRRVAV